MKRYISILLSLILIFSFIPSATVSHAAASETVWEFSDYNGTENTKTYLTRKGLYYVNGSQEMINVADYGYVAKINSASRWVLWMHPDKPGTKEILDENFILEFDFMQQTKAVIRDIATPTAEPWTDDKQAYRLYSNGTDLLIHTGAGTFTVIENYKANNVYNIKVAFNLENKTIRVWVNNTALFTDVKLAFLNDITYVGRFDFNNTTGTGDICIGKIKVSPWSDASAELSLLEEAINEADSATVSLSGGDGIGQCDETLLKKLEDAIYTAKKKLAIWENAVNPDIERIAEETSSLEITKNNAVNSVKKEFVEVYSMDFDSKSMADGGWMLTGITPGGIIDDNENKVYCGTAGTRGLRFFDTPYTKKATISFSFKQNTKTPVNKISEITSYSYNDNHRLYTMSSDGSDIFINGNKMIENYEAGKWYDIRIETDPVTKKLEVYVDKKRVLRDTTLSYLGADATVIGRWETSTTAEGSEILIDNIHIYRDVNAEFENKAAELISVFGDRNSVVSDITLPKTVDGYTIEWESSDTSVVSDSGKVTRSDTENHCVKMTAQLSRDGFVYNYTYVLYIPQKSSVSDEADIVIEERTGHFGLEFFRRGIPFSQGEYYEGENISLKHGNTLVPLQTEVIEKYPDGSVKWLSVSFMWNVEANESYDFYIVKEESRPSSTVTVKESADNVILSNDYVKATVTNTGVSALTYNGKSVLGNGGIVLKINNNYTFKADSVELVSSGPVYATVRLTGSFTGCSMTGDWFITVYNEDSRLYHEFKFTAKGDQTVSTGTMNFSFADGFNTVSFKENSPAVDTMTESDRMTISKDGLSVILSTKDVTRFKGAISKDSITNGFVYSTAFKEWRFAPIQYGAPYFWLDGVTRTARLDMSFYDTAPTPDETEREEAWAFTPPSLTVNSERFVNAGIIEDNNLSPAITRTENLITSMYGGLWNHFQAGKMPHTLEINYETEEITTIFRGGRYEEAFDRSGGEVEYNLWKSYLNTGNPVMFDILSESSEFWTDFMVYRGKIEKLQGTNRYQTKDTDHVSYRTNMPFYGDLSGLYMSYCITGDPYIKESFRLAADFWEKSISDANGVPMLSYWYNPAFPDRLNYNEEFSEQQSFQFRFSGMARGMYYAYSLFGDEKYLNAGKDIADHLPLMQLENGSFVESYYYPSFEPLPNVENDTGEKVLSEKHYIMNFGARMLTDFYNMSGYAPMLSNLKDLESYLAEKRTEDGFIWTPNSDDEVYAVPSIRGAGSPSTEMSFIAKLYQATGDTEYLYTVAQMFRNYVASWNGGNTDRVMETGKSNFMEVSQTISRILLDNRDTVIKMGFPDVIAVLDSDAQIRKDLYSDFKADVINKRDHRLAMSVFDTEMGRVVLFNNCELVTYTAENPALYKDTAFTMDFNADAEKNLWYGAKNTVRDSGVHIIADVRVTDVIPLLKTDFEIKSEEEVVADISLYTPERIEMTINSGDDVPFAITDGFFSVENDKCYVLETGGEKSLLWAENGVLSGVISAEGTTSVAIYEAEGMNIKAELVSDGNVVESLSEVSGNSVNIKTTVFGGTYDGYCIGAVYENEKLFDVKVFNAQDGATLTLPQNKETAKVKIFFFDEKLNPEFTAVVFE